MPQHTEITKITELLMTQTAKLATNGHRQMVILSGSLEWAAAQATDFITASQGFEQIHCSVVTPKGSATETLMSNTKSYSFVRADKPNTLLGYENSHVIFDAHSGFYPDALCAISGTIKASGLLLILTPPLEHWAEQEDLFAQKRTSFSCLQTPNSPQTINRFLHTALSLGAISIAETQRYSDIQTQLNTCPNDNSNTNNPNTNTNKLKQWHPQISLTTEQGQVLTDITKDSQSNISRQHSPEKSFHIIQADRGRGKSHLLGLLAKALIDQNIDNGIKSILTGPNKMSVQTVYRAYSSEPNDDTANTIAGHPLTFIAPENVLSENSQSHILLVDEAASLPIPLLKQWALHFKFIIFSTTTHGYEGTGKGFQIRFLQFLVSLQQPIHQHRLTLPIRYNSHDPVETTLFKSFCLDSEPSGLNLKTVNPQNIKQTELSQTQLAKEPELLEEVFSLLVQAHYQTRPSDLRDILDAPGLRVFVSYGETRNNKQTPKTIMAACLVFDEGNLEHEQHKIVEAIIQGKRRPKGHLIPQVLTLHMGQEDALYLKCARIVRIATLPNLQRLNLGSALLNHVTLTLKNDHYDYLGSSYADTSDVRDFWLKNNFILIRLGNKLDQSSGTRSGLVIKGLSESGKQIAVKTTVFFNQQKNKTQSFQSLSKTEQKLIGHFINSTGSYEATKDILSRNENWKALFKDKEFPKKAGIDFRELVKKWAEN